MKTRHAFALCLMAMIGLASMTDAAQAQTEKEIAKKVETPVKVQHSADWYKTHEPRPQKKSLHISPYWLVAASGRGFVLGIAVPRENRYSSTEYATLLADTSYIIGRSLAAGDINFALLVK